MRRLEGRRGGDTAAVSDRPRISRFCRTASALRRVLGLQGIAQPVEIETWLGALAREIRVVGPVTDEKVKAALAELTR